MKISVIIPVINEAENLKKLLPILTRQEVEVIVVDGGSNDDSMAIGQYYGAEVTRSSKSRALQMNKGAEIATGDVLYFVHADSLPPTSFASDIRRAVQHHRFVGEVVKPYG